MKGQYQIPPHLGLLSRKLVDVAHGRIDRLMVTMPPRCGKSLLTSQYFPAWYIGVNPDRRVILASNEAGFATGWSRKALASVMEGIIRGVFTQCKLNRKKMAAQEWETTAGGGMYAGGIGSPFTGRGANILLIDDPVKNDQDALSPTQRQHAWDWYQSTMTTRLEPGGAVILVMTRWNEDDLGGRILSSAFNDPEEIARWECINLPAFAHEDDLLGRPLGEPLWPARFSKEEWERKRAGMPAFWWSALYDQEPKPREGSLFQRGWLGQFVDDRPKHATAVRYWDRGATTKGDYTSGVRVSKDADGIYYIEHVARFKKTPLGCEKEIRALAEDDGHSVKIFMEQEPGSAGVDTISTYSRQVLSGFSFRGRRVTGSKEARADAVASQAEVGNVRIVRGDWNHDYIEEMIGFGPGCKYDDQVDATSGAFRELSRMPRRRVTRKPPGA